MPRISLEKAFLFLPKHPLGSHHWQTTVVKTAHTTSCVSDGVCSVSCDPQWLYCLTDVAPRVGSISLAHACLPAPRRCHSSLLHLFFLGTAGRNQEYSLRYSFAASVRPTDCSPCPLYDGLYPCIPPLAACWVDPGRITYGTVVPFLSFEWHRDPFHLCQLDRRPGGGSTIRLVKERESS